jgi:S1-C subfamily serine protease
LRTWAILLLALVLLVVFGTGLFAGWQFGRTSAPAVVSGLQQGSNSQVTVPALNSNNIDDVRAAVVTKVKPAVVQINVATPQGNGLGSGVIVDKRGYIVTNNHVVSEANTVEVVLFDGTRLTNVQVVGTDPADDLAVLKINPPTNIVVATLGDSSKLRVGETVMAIGNPLGITQTVTSGIVSALGRNVSEQNGAVIPNAIQTDAPINPGNSGGALVDLQGNLVGIPTLTAIDPEFNAPASGVGFAIPSNRVSFITTQIIQNGKVTHTGRAALGVYLNDVDPNLAQMDNLGVDHGALITRLTSGGPAEKAGLQVGDVIVQADNKPVDSTSTLLDILLTKNPGDTVPIHVYRGNQQLTVNVTLTELKVS